MNRIVFTVGLVAFLATFVGAPIGTARAQREPALLGKLPDDFVVYAVGSYSGTKSLPQVQLDDSGHDVCQIDVVVNVPDRPIVLVLTAYDPTVWRVGRTKDTKIAGVLVGGYHGQILIGLERETPRAIGTYHGGGPFEYFYAYKASPELLEMDRRVKEMVGKSIERFINKATNGTFYVGTAPEDDGEILYVNDEIPKKFADASKPLAGRRGVEQLIKEGKLRRATQEDIDSWVAKASEEYKRLNPDLRVEHRMRLGRTLVVLDKLTLPNGMYGAHSAAFIVPSDVPFPDGPRCHNEFYMMDGTKRGPGDF